MRGESVDTMFSSPASACKVLYYLPSTPITANTPLWDLVTTIFSCCIIRVFVRLYLGGASVQLHDLPVPLHSAWSVPHVNNSQCVIPTQFSVFLKQQNNIYIYIRSHFGSSLQTSAWPGFGGLQSVAVLVQGGHRPAVPPSPSRNVRLCQDGTASSRC